jgi:glycogen operon protein
MHVDGFRFDLASILSRDSSAKPWATPPVLWDIESDPTLAGTKLIAEAWDAAGLYQVWQFHRRQLERMERTISRRCPKLHPWSSRGRSHALPDRYSEARDLTLTSSVRMEQSVNFVTCHDGFTLKRLVSYDQKHNQRTSRDNRDGSNNNRSWKLRGGGTNRRFRQSSACGINR